MYRHYQTKTLTDSINNIMAKSLKNTTTTTDVSGTAAPSANKALIATNSTTVTWQAVKHTKLSNIWTDTHAVIHLNKFTVSTLVDKYILIYSSVNVYIIIIKDLTKCKSNIFNLQLSTGIVKTATPLVQNQVIPLTYTDNTDGNMLCVNNSSAVIQINLVM